MRSPGGQKVVVPLPAVEFISSAIRRRARRILSLGDEGQRCGGECDLKSERCIYRVFLPGGLKGEVPVPAMEFISCAVRRRPRGVLNVGDEGQVSALVGNVILKRGRRVKREWDRPVGCARKATIISAGENA